MKTCSGCKAIKPESEFGAHIRQKDGLRSRCRECERKPPRIVTCKNCKTTWPVRSRGQAPNLCPTCVLTLRWCGDCKSTKSIDAFYVTTVPSRGYRCRECALRRIRSAEGVRARKASAVKGRYGITLEEYEAHMLAPEGVCPCCGKTGRKKMCMDHDHETGEIRGVICSACNSGIGLLGDSIEGLQKAIAYLERVST